VPVQINSAITLDFTVDSGAAAVQIPVDVFSTLVRAKTRQFYSCAVRGDATKRSLVRGMSPRVKTCLLPQVHHVETYRRPRPWCSYHAPDRGRAAADTEGRSCMSQPYFDMTVNEPF